MTDPLSPAAEVPVPSLPAVLAARAAASPDEPWLFFRDRWDWQWRSWSQVADQVARAAAALRRAGTRIAGPRIGFDARLDPDAVAVELAVHAAGLIAVPIFGAENATWDGWAEVGEDAAPRDDAPARIQLPAVRSRLDRWTPETVVSSGAADAALWRSAARFAERLPALQGRPIVLASARVDRAVRRTLRAWILKTAAAWVLEPEPEWFVPAALWTRPTLVLAPAEELGILALTMASGKQRRRWTRLQAVVVTDEATEVGIADGWARVDVPVVRYSAVG